jgi:polar amino acid transport system substrate-binding protein
MKSQHLRRALLAVVCASSLGGLQAQTCTQLVASGNPEYPPFLWRDAQDDSHLLGANAELMQWLGREIGIPIEVRYVGSWARVQEEVRHGRVDLIAGAFFTVARLEYMDYFYPAFQAARSMVWMRADQPFAYKAWKDLKSKQGLTVINNSFGEEFDRFAKTELTMHTVPTLEQALRMLSMQRADYLVYEENPALAIAAKLGVTGLKAAPTAISNENLYVTLAHKSPCNTGEIRGRIAKAIAKLGKDGSMRKMLENGLRDWRRQSPE